MIPLKFPAVIFLFGFIITATVHETQATTDCNDCVFDGQTFKGNSFFKFNNGCISYDQCYCHCDGSWACPGEHAKDICIQNQTTGCNYCKVDDYLYEGNSKFDLIRDCYKYPGCDCSCDGGWTCKHTRGVYICDGSGQYNDQCGSCKIDGKRFNGNSLFHFDYKCYHLLCRCSCDGGLTCTNPVWNCKGEKTDVSFVMASLKSATESQTSDSWYRVTRQAPSENCRTCVVDGVTYRPYQNFKLESGCNTFNCFCKCDGSWQCPPERTVNKCLGPSSGGRPNENFVSETSVLSGGSGVSVCTRCNFLGKSYDGNTPFEFEKACWRYRCNCRCNGSVDCPSDKSEYICSGRKQCVKCDVGEGGESKLIDSQTDFQLRRGCIIYDKCRCNCDGGWNCDDGRDECDRCQGCRVDGFPYPGNSTFSLTRGCDKYKNCFCDCDGKWSCSGEGIEDLCGTCRKCNIGGEYYAGGTSGFTAAVDCTRYSRCDCKCDGSYTCTGGVYTCDNRADLEVVDQCSDCVHGLQTYRPGQRFDFESGCSSYRGCECKCGKTHCRQVIDSCGDCRSCQIDGIDYNGGTKFSYKKGCLQYTECDCFCNGDWKCYGTSATNTCTGCKKCNVKNVLYDAYSRFTMKQDCWEYQCFCGCDGATRCPSDTVINTCTKPDVCRRCEIDGRNIEGNSHFSYKLNSLDMSCRCNCDGSYVCIAEWVYIREDYSISGSGIGSGAGSCFRCNIDGRYYAGNSNFSISRSGVNLQCQCMCNGGYYCSGVQTFEFQGCRRCSVFGQTFQGGSPFSIIYTGVRLGCTCSCSGDYVCLGADGSVVITCQGGIGCLPQTCSQCLVDGQRINGGAKFGTIYKNTELQCDCGCDGSYYCEGGNNYVITCHNGRCVEVGCGGCRVYESNIEGGSSFDLVHRGIKLTCVCKCGGDYQCQGGTGELIVTCINNGAGCLLGSCNSCYGNGNQYAARSTFRYTYLGFDMMCQCGCDGSYYCKGVSELIEIACIGGSCNRIGCGSCNVLGLQHQGDSKFEIVYSGLKLNCDCSCDSSYICVGTTGQRIITCRNGIGCLANTCGSCRVNEREYAGRSTFRSEYKGIDLLCTCGCDGSSYCAGTTTSVEVSCINGVCTRIGCRECSLFGKEYLGSSQFELLAKGLKWNCECDCDGGYVCLSTSTSAKITCTGGVGSGCFESLCSTCRVDGRSLQAGAQFNYLYNNINFRCTCSCDSSYHCVGVSELIEISCIGGTCNPIGCDSCVVSGRSISAATQFEVVFRGLLLQCTCACDGGYLCYGEGGTRVIQCLTGGLGNCFPPSCRNCSAHGREYMANSVYKDTYNGIEVSCTCGCDGSSFCVGTSISIKISCLGGTCSPVGCTNCMLFGKEFNPLINFDIVFTGQKLVCRCDCAGGYVCTDSKGSTALECRNNRGCVNQVCNNCRFENRNYRGGEIFKYNYNNIDMSCACGCDSSVNCQGILQDIELRCVGGSCKQYGCVKCKAYGNEYDTLSNFELYTRGLKLSCECACNGGFICRGSSGITEFECKAGDRDCGIDTCRTCVTNGQTIRGGTTFRDRYEGIDVTCTCACDGSSFCVGVYELIEISCIGGICSPINCKACRVFGRGYPALSSFTEVYDGQELTCRCLCNSSYFCMSSTNVTVIECRSPSGNCFPEQCRNCIIDGNTFRARSIFPYKYRNIDMSCTCGCDGTSYCEGLSEYIIISCTGAGCFPRDCRTCRIFGEDHQALQSFDVVYQGLKLNCRCACDSSYVCTGSTGEKVIDCRDRRSCTPPVCRDCVIDGNSYRGRSLFAYRYRNIDLQCSCGCDGTAFCEGVEVKIIVSCVGSECSIPDCKTCNIFGREYQALVPFDIIYAGIRLDCECFCNSSSFCKGSTGETVVDCRDGRNCVIPKTCRDCIVDGRTYPGRSTFPYRYRDIDMQCSCGCDGTSFCQGTNIKIDLSCTGSGCSIRNCRDCTIFGRNYPALVPFNIIYSGVRLDCSCSCDTSYFCQGSTGVKVIDCPVGKTCVSEKCNDCVIDGKTYVARSNFAYRFRGIDMQCSCGCDGSSFCEGTQIKISISCTGSGCTPRDCRDCSIFGRNYPALVPFNIIYEGIQLNCDCACDSSYLCKGSGGNTVVECRDGRNCPAPTCNDCIIDGRTYSGFSTFSHKYNNIDMNCQCGCDGSAFCQGTSISIEVSCLGSRCWQVGCQNCEIFGTDYAGDSKFNIIYDGVKMDCECRCDSSYFCQGSSKSLDCPAGRRCLPRRCRKCRTNGHRYDGLEKFDFEYKGIQMSCDCGCDGTYYCVGVTTNVQISCDRRGRCTQIGGCLSCDIFGVDCAGGSRRDFIYQGKPMTCTCNCDTGYKCIGSGGETVIDCPAGRSCLTRRCETCRIGGNTYSGMEEFSYQHQGINMRCTCGCDGSYYCRGSSREELSCDNLSVCRRLDCDKCVSDGRERIAGEEFTKVYDGLNMNCLCACDGSYRCQGVTTTITIICDGEDCRLEGCRSCIVGGRDYNRGERYETRSGSQRQECICECDGSSTCNIVEEPSCKDCIIDGDRYKGHTRQRVYKNGISYICDCFCSGEGTCTAERPLCNKCIIDGTEYAGNNKFVANMNRERMDCHCSCDGSWECFGELSTCSSTTGCVDKCRQCLIDGQKYDRNSDFLADVYSGRMQCDCKCDGKFVCTSDTRICTEKSCESRCRTCVIDGTVYAGNNKFVTNMNRQRMNCHCSCDGSWECIGELATCSSTTGCVDKCRQCLIDGQKYDRNSDFLADVYGGRMQCDCKCDGKFVCTSDTRICTEKSCESRCRTCVIDGTVYAGNNKFVTNMNRQRMDCHCSCDGSWECIGEFSTCTSTTGCVDKCRQCVIDGRKYDRNSEFLVNAFGSRMQCDCKCDGTFVCTSDTRICTEKLCESRCRECVIDGNAFGQNPSFLAAIDNTRMQCRCDCDGYWECKSDTRVCTISGCRSTCQPCVIEGRSYQDRNFETTISNTRMRCSCDCSGSFDCIGGTLRCTSLLGCVNSCQGCEIEGQRYPGNTQFTIFHAAYNTNMDCNCECGGSYSCKGTINNVCHGVECAGDRCWDCVINGIKYKGDSSFETIIDGVPVSCTCSCNGGHKCVGKITQTFCTGPGCGITDNMSCRSCIFKGREYPGGRKFDIVHNNVPMVCDCACDGEMSCKGELKQICIGDGCADKNNDKCLPCFTEDGRMVTGNSRFTMTKNGRSIDCMCGCNGGYKCGASDCQGPHCGSTGCRRCTIDEVPYSGNTRFKISKGNVDYTCSCFCDGSYSCTSSSGFETSCVGSTCADDRCRPCQLDGREYKLDTRFRLLKNRLVMNCVCECDGAYRCFSISGTCSGDRCDDYGCSFCNIDGKQYKGNQEHEVRPGLICSCGCDGQYECKSASLSVQCVGENCGTDRCKRCELDGQFFPGNKRFQYTNYGLFMQCVCNCDSTYTCRGYQIISQGTDDVETWCGTCEINGRIYNGNTRFQAMFNGTRSVCSCHCDGRHSCMGSEEACRDCTIGNSRYPSNADFTLTRNGESMRCQCECNGDFICQGRKTCRDGEDCSDDGCRDCLIFDLRYKGNTRFTTDARGIRMLCQCNCDGSYSCKGYRPVTSVFIPGETVETCQTCYVGGATKEGNTKFRIQRACFSIECICSCDGTWECPFQTPKYVCQDNGETTQKTLQTFYSISGSHIYTTDQRESDSASRIVYTAPNPSRTVFGTDVAPGSSCRECKVGRNTYEGNTNFVLQDGCLRWTCACDCSGSWNCTSVEGSACSGPLDPFEARQCQDCEAFGTTHPSEQQFYGSDECYRYTCTCNCDGSWECPPQLTVQTCPDTSLIYSEERGNCRRCELNGNTYNYRETFTFVSDCIQYLCTCKCDGSYNCPGSTAVRVCRGGSGLSGRPVGTGSNTIEKIGQTVVALHPVGYGTSKTGYSETDGGYRVMSSEYEDKVPDSVESIANYNGKTITVLGSGGGADTRYKETRTRTGVKYSTGSGSNFDYTSGASTGTEREGSYTGSFATYGLDNDAATRVASRGAVGNSEISHTSSSFSTGASGGDGVSGVEFSTGEQGQTACRNCLVDNQALPWGRDFTFRSGCFEYLCECFCNGSYVCPAEKSTNVCEGAKPETGKSGKPLECRIGNRTYNTRLFSFTRDCYKFTCRCEDTGAYECDNALTKYVC